MDTMYNLMYLSIKMGIFMDGDAKQPTFFVEPEFYVEPKSVGYEEKEKGQTLNFEDLSTLAPELGLEPRTL